MAIEMKRGRKEEERGREESKGANDLGNEETERETN